MKSGQRKAAKKELIPEMKPTTTPPNVPLTRKAKQMAQRRRYYEMGFTDKEIAEFTGVSVFCIRQWRKYRNLKANKKPPETVPTEDSR